MGTHGTSYAIFHSLAALAIRVPFGCLLDAAELLGIIVRLQPLQSTQGDQELWPGKLHVPSHESNVS